MTFKKCEFSLISKKSFSIFQMNHTKFTRDLEENFNQI